MRKPEVLILNMDLMRDNDHILSTSKTLQDQGIGVVSTDFWNVPTYITEAIEKKNMHIIVLSSIHKSQTEQIINKLRNLNKSNLPVIDFRESKVEDKQESKILYENGINKTLSITETPWDSLITYIRQQANMEEDVLNVPKKIAHIGIAVKNIEKTLSFYNDSLGLQLEGLEEVVSEGVKVAFLKIGESNIELLEPLTNSSPVQKFLDQRGEGIHHLALEVDNIETRLSQLKANDIQLINEHPKLGAKQSQIAFIHPKSANGVLFELCQYSKEGK